MIDVEISVWKVSGAHLAAPLWQVEVRSTQRPARQPVSPIADGDLAAIADLPTEARTWPGFLTALSPGDGHYSPGPRVLREVGELLYRRLLGAAEVSGHLQAVEARALRERRLVRYLLELEEDDPGLAGLPLELLHDGHDFLFKRPRRPAFRLASKRDAYNLRLGHGSRVLIATAHSEDPPEPSRETLQSHAKDLVDAVVRAGFAAEHLADATAAALSERLLTGERVDLLYIACHGTEDRDQAGLLALRGEPLPGTELGRLLEEATELGRPVEAVILCACSSAAPRAEHGTLGMAQWLADRNRAAATIGFRGPVLVPWALAFTERLFERLGQGAALEVAFSDARHREPDGEPQWPLPVLYCPRPDPLAPGRREEANQRGILGELPEALSLDVQQPAALPLPSRLPRQPKPYFTGRQADLEALRRWASTPGAAVITAVQGQGGIGKSELASVFAHEVRAQGRAVVWLDRPDFDLDGSVAALLSLARPSFQAPPQATRDDLAAVMRRDLAPYAGLLVLDDVRDRQAVELLSPGEGWNVLVTTRTQGLVPRVEAIELGPLEPEDALRLLSRVAWDSEEPPEAEREGAARLAERLGRLPLALELAGSTLRNLVTSEEYLESLELGEGVAASDQERVAAVLGRSLRDLAPEDLEAFMALGVLPPVGSPAQVVATTLGQPLPATTRRLDRLVRHSVAAWSPETGRYRLHPELRQEARKRVEADAEVWARLHEGAAKAILELAAWIYKPVGEQTQMAHDRWAGNHEFFDTIDLGPWREKGATGGGSVAMMLCLSDTFRRSLDIASRESFLLTAESLTSSTDLLLRARLLKVRGELRRFRDDLDSAAADYDEALQLFQTVEDRLGQAGVLQVRGDLRYFRSDLAGAANDYDRAFELFVAMESRLGQAMVLKARGDLESFRDELDAAAKDYDRALELFTSVDDRLGQASALNARGDLKRFSDDLEAAAEDYGRALELFAAMENRLGQAGVLVSRAELARRRSDPEGAARDYDRAMELFVAVEDRLGQANVLQFRGDLARGHGDAIAAARAWYNQSLSVYREVGDSLGLSNALAELVALDLAEGRLEEARTRLEEAFPLAQKSENRYALSILEAARESLALQDCSPPAPESESAETRDEPLSS